MQRPPGRRARLAARPPLLGQLQLVCQARGHSQRSALPRAHPTFPLGKGGVALQNPGERKKQGSQSCRGLSPREGARGQGRTPGHRARQVHVSNAGDEPGSWAQVALPTRLHPLEEQSQTCFRAPGGEPQWCRTASWRSQGSSCLGHGQPVQGQARWPQGRAEGDPVHSQASSPLSVGSGPLCLWTSSCWPHRTA